MTTLNTATVEVTKEEAKAALMKNLNVAQFAGFKGNRRPQVDNQFKAAKSQEGGKAYRSFSAKVATHAEENQAHYKSVRHSEVTHNMSEEMALILGEVSPEEYEFVGNMIFNNGTENDGSEDGLLIAYSTKVRPNRSKRSAILNSCQEYATKVLRKKWADLKDSQKANIIRKHYGTELNKQLFDLDAEYSQIINEYNHRIILAGELFQETFGKGKHWRLAAIAYQVCINWLHRKRDEHAKKHHNLNDYHDTHMGALLTLFQSGIKECLLRIKMQREQGIGMEKIEVSHNETFKVFFHYADVEELKQNPKMKADVEAYFENLVDFTATVKRINGIPHLVLGEWEFPVKGDNNPLFPMDEAEWEGVLVGWKAYGIGLSVQFTARTGVKYVPEKEVSLDASFSENDVPGAFNWSKPVENIMASVQYPKGVDAMALQLAGQVLEFRQGNGFVVGFLGGQPFVKHTDGVIAPGTYIIVTHGESFMVLQPQ